MIKLSQNEKPEEQTKIKILPFAESLKYDPTRPSTHPNFLIFMKHSVFIQINNHLSTTLEEELGGFLLGDYYECPKFKQNFILIDEAIEAKETEGGAAHLRFTNDTYAHLEEHREESGKKVLGWYHSHPKMGVFLSQPDLFIHRGFFREPYQVALVVEPDKHQGGFFHWSNPKEQKEKNIDPNHYTGFYDFLDCEEPMKPWTNLQPVTSFPEYIYNLLNKEEISRFLEKVKRFLPGS